MFHVNPVAKSLTLHRQSQFPELSPIVYGGGQIRGTYRGHGASLLCLSANINVSYLNIPPELIEHGGDVPGSFSQSITYLAVAESLFQGFIHKLPDCRSTTSEWRFLQMTIGLDLTSWQLSKRAFWTRP